MLTVSFLCTHADPKGKGFSSIQSNRNVQTKGRRLTTSACTAPDFACGPSSPPPQPTRHHLCPARQSRSAGRARPAGVRVPLRLTTDLGPPKTKNKSAGPNQRRGQRSVQANVSKGLETYPGFDRRPRCARGGFDIDLDSRIPIDRRWARRAPSSGPSSSPRCKSKTGYQTTVSFLMLMT